MSERCEDSMRALSYRYYSTLWIIEPEFVNLLRNPGIYSQPVGIYSLESIPGLLKHLQIRALMDTIIQPTKISLLKGGPKRFYMGL
jgi:hypothetical protein